MSCHITRAGRLDGVEDLGSLLRYRIQKVAATYQPSARRVSLIAGLVPRATGITDPALRQALQEREQLMQQRLEALTTTAIERPEPWTRTLDGMDPDARVTAVRAVVAYRDRWGITSTSPLGPVPDDDAQRVDYERARAVFPDMQDREAPEGRGPSRSTRRSLS